MMKLPDMKLKSYSFSYACDGVEYAMQVAAYSQEEAVARVRRMSTAVYDGEIVAVIPASMSWLGRIVVSTRNWLRPI